MTSFSFGLGSTLVLCATLHPIVLAASGITASDDFVHCVVMVLTRGVGGAKGIVGWRAKALGWKEEIWGGKVDDCRRQ